MNRQLMSQAQQELTDATLSEKVLEFIKAVVIDRFSDLSREELEVMLNLDSLKKVEFIRKVERKVERKVRS
jgi:predicted transposase YdaD